MRWEQTSTLTDFQACINDDFAISCIQKVNKVDVKLTLSEYGLNHGAKNILFPPQEGEAYPARKCECQKELNKQLLVYG